MIFLLVIVVAGMVIALVAFIKATRSLNLIASKLKKLMPDLSAGSRLKGIELMREQQSIIYTQESASLLREAEKATKIFIFRIRILVVIGLLLVGMLALMKT